MLFNKFQCKFNTCTTFSITVVKIFLKEFTYGKYKKLLWNYCNTALKEHSKG